jgi:anti-sigma regulatory factor (Ser/Thr protein kinase)
VIVVTAAYPVTSADQRPPRWVRVFPGEPSQVRQAREYVARVLTRCPARQTLLTCVSELAANAVTHTASGAGGVFTVEVLRPGAGRALVAVTDGGSRSEPTVRPARDLAEGGRGLALVAALSSRWGYCVAGQGRTVWAEATWPVAVPGPDAKPGPPIA